MKEIQPGERLLRFAEVSSKVGLGRSAIYERIAKGTFPRPTKVGAASRWVSSEVDAWLARGIESRVFQERMNTISHESFRHGPKPR